MSNLFEDKNISPMLLYETQPFDDENYIYELKLDGIRCIAYIDGKSVVLQNKRHKDVTAIYPELAGMNKCVKRRVILDGELVVLDKDGKPDFYALQRRSLMVDSFKISLAAKSNPVQFVAYDIIYIDRLIREDNAVLNKTYFYEYDDFGNIEKITAYNYTTGNSLTGGVTKTYLYDSSKRLISVTEDGVTQSISGYDALGNPSSYKGKALTWTRGRNSNE